MLALEDKLSSVGFVMTRIEQRESDWVPVFE